METPLQHVVLGKPVECKRCVPKDAMAASRAPPPARAPYRPADVQTSYGPAPGGYGRAQPEPAADPGFDKNEAYARAYAEGYAAAKMEIQNLLNGGGPAAPAKGAPYAGKGKGAAPATPYGRPY